MRTLKFVRNFYCKQNSYLKRVREVKIIHSVVQITAGFSFCLFLCNTNGEKN